MKIVPAPAKTDRTLDCPEAVDGKRRVRIVRTRCETCGREGLLERSDTVLANIL